MKYLDSDVLLRNKFTVVIDSTELEFQFPPKILSDGRKGTWSEGDLRGTEPIAIFSTSGAREFTLSTVYVIDGDIWTAEKIHKQISLARSYYTKVSRAGTSDPLVVEIKLAGIGGQKDMTARIKNASTKYSETYVGDFPLRTDLTIDFAIWAQTPPLESQKGNAPPASVPGKIYAIGGLSTFTPDWD